MYTKLFQRLFDLTQRREVTSTKKTTLKNVEMFAEKAGWEKKKKIKKIKIIQRRYQKEPKDKRYVLILDLKPFRS